MGIKTTIKLISCTITMLLVGLASCNNIADAADQNGQDPNEGKTMSIQLNFNAKNQLPSHKLGSEDNSGVNDKDIVTLSSGYLLFVKGDPDTHSLENLAMGSQPAVVQKALKIITEGQTTQNAININDLKGTCTIKGVPRTCSQIVVLGNTDNKLKREIEYGDQLKDIIDYTLNVNTQTTNDSQNQETNLRDASLIGAAPINFIDPNDRSKGGSVQVFLVPLVSRIEIDKITNIKDEAGNLLTDYKLRGIFIDSIPVNGRVGGIWFNKLQSSTKMFVLDDNDVLKAGKASEFTPNDGDFKYKKYQGYVCDYADWSSTQPDKTIGKRHQDGADTPVYYTPNEASKVWAYNFFAGYEYYERKDKEGDPYDGVIQNQVIGMPYVALNIGKIQPTDPSDNLFMVVKNFYDGNRKRLDLAEPGKLYHINEIKFSRTDLHPDPSPTKNDVTVSISFIPWKTYNVNPPKPD